MSVEVQLVRYDALCAAIEKVRTLDDVKDIRDKAEAMRAWRKIATNETALRYVVEIKARAELKRQKAERHLAHQAERQARRAEVSTTLGSILAAKASADTPSPMGEMQALQAAFELACRDGTFKTATERVLANAALMRKKAELTEAGAQHQDDVAATSETFVRDYLAAHPGAPFAEILELGVAAGHKTRSLGRAYARIVTAERTER